MSKKVGISKIALSCMKIFNLTEQKIFVSSRVNNSSDKFDNTIATIIEAFLPVLIMESFYFYDKTNTQTLSVEEIKQIEKSKQRLSKNLEDTYSGDSLSPFANKISSQILNQFSDLRSVTKEQFLKKNRVIFNDKSKEHEQAFSKKGFPDKNILIKLVPDGIHIRVGIRIEKNDRTEVIIEDIVNKKTRNSG